MLYLVNCEVIKYSYQSDTKTIEKNHIVEASSEKEAEDKVRYFYSKKNQEFHVSYHVNFNYCNEVIT